MRSKKGNAEMSARVRCAPQRYGPQRMVSPVSLALSAPDAPRASSYTRRASSSACRFTASLSLSLFMRSVKWAGASWESRCSFHKRMRARTTASSGMTDAEVTRYLSHKYSFTIRDSNTVKPVELSHRAGTLPRGLTSRRSHSRCSGSLRRSTVWRVYGSCNSSSRIQTR
eukprot:scaffold3611_cov131-Isochrysis_galbana.AAC.4